MKSLPAETLPNREYGLSERLGNISSAGGSWKSLYSDAAHAKVFVPFTVRAGWRRLSNYCARVDRSVRYSLGNGSCALSLGTNFSSSTKRNNHGCGLNDTGKQDEMMRDILGFQKPIMYFFCFFGYLLLQQDRVSKSTVRRKSRYSAKPSVWLF